jgi:hypothetical protein
MARPGAQIAIQSLSGGGSHEEPGWFLPAPDVFSFLRSALCP